MSARLVVIHSRDNDPVARVLGRARLAECVGVDEIAEHMAPGAWPTPITTSYPPSLSSKFDGASVINRNFSYDGTSLARKLAQWELHTLWGDNAIRHLTRRAASTWHDFSIKGVSRSLLPLNAQWFELKRFTDAFDFPRFVYGFGKVQPDTGDFDDPIQKSVWSLFDWKEERHLTDFDRNWHKFYVDRPSGVPVVSYYAGSDTKLLFPKGGEDARSDLHATFSEMSRACTRVFGSKMGECLSYIGGDGRVTFCAFSPHMATAAGSPGFEDFLLASIGRRVD